MSFWGTTKPPFGTQLDPSHPLSQGLVGFWPGLEGSGHRASDLITSNDATRAGTAIWAPAEHGSGPVFNSVWTFDGSNGCLGSAPAHPIYGINKGTMALWYRSVVGQTGNVWLMGRSPSSGGDGVYLLQQSGVVTSAYDTSTGAVNQSTPNIDANDGKWHLVVYSFERLGRVQLWVDGRLLASAAETVDNWQDVSARV